MPETREQISTAPPAREGGVDIVALVGDPPGAGCGMGDFVGVMNPELERRGYLTATVLIPGLNGAALPELRRRLKLLAPKIIHLQFPSMSLGRDPIVSVLPLIYREAPWLISLCEFEVLNPLRQASLALLPRTFDGYIFTSARERDYCARLAPGLPKRAEIIPALSNIPVVEGAARAREDERLRRVVYFGQIVPQRGIEDFLTLAELARTQAPDMEFHLVGATPAWARAYTAEILASAATLDVITHLNANDRAASQLLSSAAFAYFPYPDGATLKRGTLPAALEHGMLLITRWSEKTEADVRAATIEAAGPSAALAHIRTLRVDAAARARQMERVEAYKARYSLQALTDRYIAFYARFGLPVIAG